MTTGSPAIRYWQPNAPKPVAIHVCAEHAVEIWEIVELRDQVPFLREVLATEIGRRDDIRAACREAEKAETRKAVTSLDAQGEIYYAKVGALIKVGWTSDLYQRMKSYGPEAELLACYPATRRDESHLHRNLTPSRAKGRASDNLRERLAVHVPHNLGTGLARRGVNQ